MQIDAGKELRRAVDTGKILFGLRSTERSILKGESRLVIISGNAEKYAKERVIQLCNSANVPFFEFGTTGLDIGSYSGKPFVVSFASVLDGGKSRLLDLAKSKK